MNFDLQSVGTLVGIIVGASAIVKYLIITPLQKDIKLLRESIECMQCTVKELTVSNRALEISQTNIIALYNEHERRITKLEEKVFK